MQSKFEEEKSFYELFGIAAENHSNISIDDSIFSVRVLNCLKRNGIFTIADLMKTSTKQLKGFRNFGATCLDEINTFFRDMDFSESGISCQTLGNNSFISDHKVQIFAGDFSFANECKNEADKAIIERYKVAFNDLDRDLIRDCENNSENIKPLLYMLFDFVKSNDRVFEISELFDKIPLNRRELRIYPFINAFSLDEEERKTLQTLFLPEDTLAKVTSFQYVEKASFCFSLYRRFLNWCSFDVVSEIDKMFNDLYHNERAKIVIERRSKRKTLMQIGEELNITRERVRQIESKVKRRFAFHQARLRIVSKIYAERNGDSVLTPLEIEDFCEDRIDELLFLLRDCKNSAYTYDSQLDVFIVGDDSLSDRAQEYVETLPEYFNKKDIDVFLEEAEETEGLPKELLLKSIEENFRLTGETYHRSHLSLSKVYEIVLSEYYPDGFRAYDSVELDNLRELIKEKYGDINLPKNNHALTSRIADVCILCGRGIYKPKKDKYISKQLANEMLTYINHSEDSVFLMNTIFSIFEENLRSEGVDNKYYLQGILRELFGDRFVFRRDYLSKDGADTSIYKQIARLIAKSQYPVSKKQIQDAYPGITEIVISFAVSEPDILNYFGSYLHASKLSITNSEKEYLRGILQSCTADSTPHFEDEILDIINKEKPEIFSRNAAMYSYGMFSILEYVFGDEFQFSRPYISKNGIEIESASKRLKEKVYSSDTHLINDIMNYAKEVHYTVYGVLDFLNSINDDYLIIDSDHIKQITDIGIDVNYVGCIEGMILNEISDCTPIVGLRCLHKFKKINVPWTDWLVYSVLNKWSKKLTVATSSNQFRHAVPLVAPAGQMSEDKIKQFESYKPTGFVQADNLDDIDNLIADYIGENLL